MVLHYQHTDGRIYDNQLPIYIILNEKHTEDCMLNKQLTMTMHSVMHIMMTYCIYQTSDEEYVISNIYQIDQHVLWGCQM